ncbi:glycosyltransferase [Rhizobium rhizogenes]|uniref:glycosyltransferase n=1 Tax=Rhizobium rhizogenes TaxID=359 RepID=UPI0015749C61|nr:glycosyltransferase [Rhizobium rhizogenes]NTH23016.1 glycosyltransferase [Rhizobium rhizogenes]NTH36046.1 glycosyltransferase [Rhizobium rhizogenes]
MIKVIHIPGRTPYARKLECEQFTHVNGLRVGNTVVPRDASLSWLLKQDPWDWFDVVHLHHVEFEPLDVLSAALDRCKRVGKCVLFTAHDLLPIFSDLESYRNKQSIISRHKVSFICLTPRAELETQREIGCSTYLLPHGYVTAPDDQNRRVGRTLGPTRFLIYGSLRRNRDVSLVLHCWRFARNLKDTTLHLVLRAPSRASLADDAEVWQTIQQHSSDPRLEISVLPYPTDSEINCAMRNADCLLLPYRWSNHSGQIEHAFDFGLLPIATNVGYLPDQVKLHGSLVNEPIWVDWFPYAPYDHGAQLLDAMERAHKQIQSGWIAPNVNSFWKHRAREHRSIVDGYHKLYQKF